MKALSGLVIVAAVLAAGVAGFTHGATQTIESPIESPSESESIQMEYGCVGNNHAEPTGLQRQPMRLVAGECRES